jgi:ribose-phosphate pyrophosphokinase
MKSKFTIKTTFYTHEFDTTLFSGGEINVKVSENLSGHDTIYIEANIMDAEGLMTLAMLKDAVIREAPYAEIDLYLGYVPYARQDRVCNPGESLSIKVFCDMINAMNFHAVTILDPHSDVTPALLNRCTVIPPEYMLARPGKELGAKLRNKQITLVAPDAGSTKKVEKVSKYFGGLEIIQGMKKRDTETGRLTGFEFYGDVAGKDLLIVDDICDGGGTFLGLTSKLKVGGAKTVSLYVSHGIFSKGIEVLFDGGIDKIYTTDSFNSDHISNAEDDDRLEIINWI